MTLKIDPDFKSIMPALSGEEYRKLETSLITNGFTSAFPIITWNGFIADGHNRYEICAKHHIRFSTEELRYDTKTEVVSWIVTNQLSRRNLTDIQRIEIVEKQRIFIEKLAAERKSKNGGDRRSKKYKEIVRQNNPYLVPPVPKNKAAYTTNGQLAAQAQVSKETYRQAMKVLNSDDEDLKQAMRNKEKSINAAYKELMKNQIVPCNGTDVSPECRKACEEVKSPNKMSVSSLTSVLESTFSDILNNLGNYVPTQLFQEREYAGYTENLPLIKAMSQQERAAVLSSLAKIIEESTKISNKIKECCKE